MRLWMALVSLTGLFIVFQNCGEVQNLPSEYSEITDEALSDNRNTEFGQTSDSHSISATLFRAFDYDYDAGSKVIRDQGQNGYNLVIENSEEWVQCSVIFGGGEGQTLGTLVLKYSCSSSDSSFSESKDPTSISKRLFTALSSTYELQPKTSHLTNSVVKNGDSYMLSDLFGTLICSVADDVFLCEYSKN